jgi:hypothetical protein
MKYMFVKQLKPVLKTSKTDGLQKLDRLESNQECRSESMLDRYGNISSSRDQILNLPSLRGLRKESC